jgi:hypothetical protein
MLTRNPKDFWPGFIYMAFGISALIIARDYKMGTALKMGPAYFPAIVSALLVLVGIISVVRSFVKEGSPIGSFTVKGLFIIAASTLVFGFILRGAGLIIALPVFVISSFYASRWFNWRHSIMLAVGVAAFCIIVFLKGLGIPIPLVGSWFGR